METIREYFNIDIRGVEIVDVPNEDLGRVHTLVKLIDALCGISLDKDIVVIGPHFIKRSAAYKFAEGLAVVLPRYHVSTIDPFVPLDVSWWYVGTANTNLDRVHIGLRVMNLSEF